MENIYTSVVADDLTELANLQRDLSRKPPGFLHSRKYKDGLWDGNICFLTRNKFLTGLMPLVLYYIERAKGKYIIEDLRVDPSKELNAVDLHGVELRDYQWEAIAAVIQHKRGAIAAATNSGKSNIACGAYQALGVKTLFLTHRQELLEQIEENFQGKLGIDVGRIWKNRTDYDSAFAVGMVGTLSSRLEDPATKLEKCFDTTRASKHNIKSLQGSPLASAKDDIAKETLKITKAEKQIKSLNDNLVELLKEYTDLVNYLESVEMIIVDESHHVVASTYETILELCPNAYYRIGLSGTPFVYDDDTKLLKSIGLLGYSIFDITNKELIDQGVSSLPHIRMLAVQNFIGDVDYNKAYNWGIVRNKERNDLIVHECKSFIERKLNTLVIINLEEHGELLQDYLISNGIPRESVAFISGNAKNKKIRAEFFDKFKKGKLPILIASLIVQEGVSMESIGALVFALGGKSDTRVLQCLGRGLRRNNYNNQVEVIDFVDGTNKYLLEHSINRWDTYLHEGFEKYLEAEEIPLADKLLGEVLQKMKKK
jgi:superfamily II DNA or RNA helicase